MRHSNSDIELIPKKKLPQLNYSYYYNQIVYLPIVRLSLYLFFDINLYMDLLNLHQVLVSFYHI